MPLTDAQLATFKADILANTDPAVVTALGNGDAGSIAAWYNLDASPDFWAWKEKLPEEDIYRLTSPNATTWDWTFFAGMTGGEQNAWARMLGPSACLEMSLPQVRSGLDAIYSGPQGGADANAHIKAMGRELASNAEKLFASGTGSTADPATRTFTGLISHSDVSAALNS